MLQCCLAARALAGTKGSTLAHWHTGRHKVPAHCVNTGTLAGTKSQRHTVCTLAGTKAHCVHTGTLAGTKGSTGRHEGTLQNSPLSFFFDESVLFSVLVCVQLQKWSKTHYYAKVCEAASSLLLTAQVPRSSAFSVFGSYVEFE